MKRKLNTICILIFFALGISIFFNVIGGLEGSKEALTFVQSNEESTGNTPNRTKEPTKVNFYRVIRMNPSKDVIYPDSIQNKKDGSWIPVQYREITAGIEKEMNKTEMVCLLFILLIELAAMIVALLNFIRLIQNVNLSIIFEWSNVKKLRWVGYSLITLFVINLGLGYYSSLKISKLVSFENYSLTWFESIQLTNLLLGLVSLLVAEIFAMGLKLKQEQDLTI